MRRVHLRKFFWVRCDLSTEIAHSRGTHSLINPRRVQIFRVYTVSGFPPYAKF